MMKLPTIILPFLSLLILAQDIDPGGPLIKPPGQDAFSWTAYLDKGLELASDPKRADELAEWLANLPEGSPEYIDQQIEAIYRRVNQLEPAARLNVANNYAVFLAKDERARKAQSLLRLEWSKADLAKVLTPDQEARCYYNYARILADLDKAPTALDYYIRAATKDPRFSGPAERAFALILERKRSNELRRGLKLCETLLDQGRHSVVQPFLKDLLASDTSMLKITLRMDFMRLWANFLMADEVDPKAYKRHWWPDLKKAWTKMGMSEDLESLAGGEMPSGTSAWNAFAVIHNVFEGRWHGLTDEQARELVRLSQMPTKDMSRFLTLQGRYFFDARQPEVALRFLKLAGDIDPQNIQAGLYLSSLLLAHETIDPGNRVLNQLAQRKFAARGDYKQRELQQIFNFHSVLGTLYQQRNIIGETTRDLTSAMAQWQLAENTYKQQQDARPAPKLYENLGSVYAQADKKQLSWDAYTQATQQYVQLERVPKARQTFTKRMALNVPPRSSQIQQETELALKLFAPPQGNDLQKQRVAQLMVEQVASTVKEGEQAVDFSGLDLSGYDFTDMDLTGAKFDQAKLNGAVFNRTNLTDVDLETAELTDAKIKNSNLDRTKIKLDNLQNLKLNPKDIQRLQDFNKKQIQLERQ